MERNRITCDHHYALTQASALAGASLKWSEGRNRKTHLPDLVGMVLFVRIVEQGSMSAAGRSLGMPKATISRRLALLERVRPFVYEAQAAQTELVAANAEPTGLLRMSASVAHGQLVVAPGVVSFGTRFPKVRIDLQLGDERVSVIAGGYDLVVRMGPVADTELIGRPLGDMSVVIVDAPSYLEIRGMPMRRPDLGDHNAVVAKPELDHWQLGEETVRVCWCMSGGTLGAVRLALFAGMGVGRVPEFMIAGDLVSGAFVRLLPTAVLRRSTATALYSRTTTPSAALQTLIQ